MKLRLLPLLVLIPALLASCTPQNPDPSQSPASPTPDGGSPAPSAQTETAADYFPIRPNVRYVYQGEGNEYASYDLYLDYTTDTKVQQRINNGGTELVQVIEVADGKVTRLFRQEEVYYRENFLNKTDGAQEVLLMEPIQAGTSWTLSDGSVRRITGVAVPVDTPSGSYSAVCVETAGTNGTTTDYYAKDVGLVKTVTAGDGYEVSSSLSEIQENAPLTQSIRFYYPNINDDKLYFKDREISFSTNDITRKVLEAAYREQIPGQPGRVFSEHTRINSYYLNRDGMAYLDLSADFLTEMNAGAGYESMILQCIANTFGSYCGADKVILTIDNSLYASGHIALEKGEALHVQTDGCVPLP